MVSIGILNGKMTFNQIFITISTFKILIIKQLTLLLPPYTIKAYKALMCFAQ
jgi:hypothetical protein